MTTPKELYPDYSPNEHPNIAKKAKDKLKAAGWLLPDGLTNTQLIDLRNTLMVVTPHGDKFLMPPIVDGHWREKHPNRAHYYDKGMLTRPFSNNFPDENSIGPELFAQISHTFIGTLIEIDRRNQNQ